MAQKLKKREKDKERERGGGGGEKEREGERGRERQEVCEFWVQKLVTEDSIIKKQTKNPSGFSFS